MQHHGPVLGVVEVSRNSAKNDEHYKTLQYMSMFGWENVRGSSYCKVQMFNPPEALQSFVRSRDSEFDYLTRQEIEAVLEAIKDMERMHDS